MDNRQGVTITSDDLFSISNAAKELGQHRVTIYRWIDAGKILSVKLGGVLFIPKSEIKRLKAKEVEAENTKIAKE